MSCSIGSADRRLTITLTWYDLQNGGAPVVSTQAGSLDLRVDSVILQAIDSLVLAVDHRIGQLAKARAVRVQAAAPAAPPSAAPPAGRPAETSAAVPSRRLLLTTGFAPFIAIGPASYYFSVGFLPSILASMEFSSPGRAVRNRPLCCHELLLRNGSRRLIGQLHDPLRS